MKLLIALVSSLVLLLSSTAPAFAISQDDFDAINRNAIFYEPDATPLCSVVGGGGVGVVGEEAERRREQAYNYFIALERGLTAEQSAGIVGNLMVETGGTMDPSVEQHFVNNGFDPDVETGYGLAQWTSIGRKYNLLAFSEATGRTIDDFYMQLDFIWFEMTGEPPTQGLSAGERAAYNDLILTTSTEDAAVSFARKYERNQASIDFSNGILTYQEAFTSRINAAEDAYAAYSGNPATSVPSGSASDCSGPVSDGSCAPGTINLGVHSVYESGEETVTTLCALTNLPSTGGASTPGSQYYVEGSDGLAIVRAEVSAVAYQMIEDATADGVVLRANSSFRPHEQQIDLCNANSGCRNGDTSLVATPGYSSHESGTAFDFYNMSSTGGSTCSSRATSSSAEYQWMFANAENYGYLQYAKEAWHWDTRSDLSNRCDSSET